MNDLTKSLNNAKRNKAPGLNGISNDFLKDMPSNWKLYLLALYNKILEKEEVPEDWSKICMCMLHKKGDPNDPTNYRGIALVNCIMKIFTSIINERQTEWVEKNNLPPEEQTGFREGRSCENNIITLQMALQLILRHTGAKALILFIDFRKAFDTVPHQKLWNKLHKIGVCPNLINILRKLCDSVKMYIEKLETARIFFYKRLFNLSMCTPIYAMRLELGIDHISVSVLKNAINWVTCIIKMPDIRLVKQSLLRMAEIQYNSPQKIQLVPETKNSA